MSRDPRDVVDHANQVAHGTMDRLCEGAVLPTALNLLVFQVALARLALVRGFARARNQRSLLR